MTDDTMNHPLVRGDKKRMHALTLLRSTQPWPSASAFGEAVGWSKSQAAIFKNEVRLFDAFDGNQPSGRQGGSSGRSGPSGRPDERVQTVQTQQNQEDTDRLDDRLDTSSGRPPNCQILSPHPSINKLPPSDYDSEASSLRSESSESPSAAAPRKSTQEKFDFGMIAEIRADLIRELIFGFGLRLLMLDGSAEKPNRAFLGERQSELGKQRLAKAICDAVLDEAIEPRAFLAACKRRPNDESQTTTRAAAEHDPSRSAYYEPWWDDDDFTLIDMQLERERKQKLGEH